MYRVGESGVHNLAPSALKVSAVLELPVLLASSLPSALRILISTSAVPLFEVWTVAFTWKG